MGPQAASHTMSMSEQADELEERMMHELTDKIATKSVLFTLADGKDGKVADLKEGDMIAVTPETGTAATIVVAAPKVKK